MRESKIERHLIDAVARNDGTAYKFVSPARRAVPDRLCLRRISDPEHARIVARYVRFVECKAPGEKPTAAQDREHGRLRALGYAVTVVDSREAVDVLYPTKELL